MQTPRLELVRLAEHHAPGYHAIWSDPIATRWSPHGCCTTFEDSKKWMSELLLDVNPRGENYAVLLRSDINLSDVPTPGSEGVTVGSPGGFLGWVGTWKSEPIPEVGFIFHRSAWGLGFATEALNAFVQLYWQSKPQFNSVEAYCDSKNGASVNVLRKCGFELVESIPGDYVLSWMEPSLRSSLRFRAIKPDTESRILT
ncbi:uncharacterized protein N7482_007096 [Penicillium canariense]|uniref:N-acetyltransferase domain-containing protein n=1 Tax=Penicillium canariense TaxID=189055 RepID=A0A9W9HYZ5_9EURO|nr:uncharacterized protein N7482_007096 [Penicillium canariense]KAJ5160092.1 hypothetical protein N7482_007096 [Penicillium canariense]